MPQINILNILQGDNQSTIVDKLNYNFDQILSAGGGPQGAQGLIGPTGPIGPQGPQGVQGAQGPSGTKWFVQDSAPSIGGITGSNPWTYPTLGDYWLDPDSANQDVYVFTATGWVNTGYGLNAGELFQKVVPLNVIGGATGSGILIAGDGTTGATATTVVLSDASISEYTPGGSSIDNVNYEGAKLKIATRNDRTKILSFGRASLDVTTATGSTGYQKNPSLDWDSSNPKGSNFYDITLNNPGGAIGIRSTSPSASGGVNIFSNGEITAESASDNILLKTASVNKGTFIDASSNGGFLELSNQAGPSPVNNSNAPLFANSTGVGIGLGTGQFKQSGDDSRKLSVFGNTSISKTGTYHTSPLFLGGPTASNYNKGVLFVEGIGMFGYTNPTGDNSGGIQTTGSSEASGRYPQLFVTSPDYGPGLQVKTKGVNYSPRTIVGDGVFDSISGNTSAGTGPDITQEFFAGTGYSFTASKSLISYQHKISNASNTGVTGSVFSISTITGGGVYDPLTVANKTLIQTKNSNRLLELMANGTGDANRVKIGVINQPLISVLGPSGSATGGVTIGALASSLDYQPTLGSLTGTNFISGPWSDGAVNIPNHSLVVTGMQTIGTRNPISLFNPVGPGNFPKGSMPPVSKHSLLKVSRNLFNAVNTKGLGISASGTYPNGYPNGIEITSFIPSSPTAPFVYPSRSVAIAVGATDVIRTALGDLPTANPTGFFVSDTGENVAVGQYIDFTAAIGVSGAGTDYAIKAKGNVGVTGGVQISGSLSVTGDVSIVDNGFDTSTWTKINPVNQSGANSLGFNVISGTDGTDSVIIGINNNNYQNTTLSSAEFTSPSVNYDRVLYGYNSGSNAIGTQCIFQISNDGGGTWRTLGRTVDAARSGRNAYSSFNMIVPAGCIIKLYFSGTETYTGSSGSGTLPNGTSAQWCWRFTISKLGK